MFNNWPDLGVSRGVDARILPMTEIVDFGMVWLAWIAWGGLGLMAVAMLLLAAIRQPLVAAQARRLFLRASTMRGRLLFGFGFVALLPMVTLPPLVGLNSASRLQSEQVAGLESLAQSVGSGIPSTLANRVDIINGLAKHISAGGNFNESALVGWLTRHHEDNPEFVSMWIARPDGHVPVATVVRNGSAERWSGPMAGVSAMDFFQESVKQDGHYVSTVRKGTSPGFHAMVFISAPVGNAGEEPWGYLQGRLDLSKVFGFLAMQDAPAGSEIFITDAQNQVILSSSRLQFRAFENLNSHPLITAMNRQQEAAAFAFKGTILASGETDRYVAATRTLPGGWQVFAVASQAPVQSAALMPLLVGGLWILMALLLAYGLAGLYGEAVSKPLRQLDESLEIFETEGTMRMLPTAPADAPSEVRDVYKKVRSSMRARRDAYHNMMKALKEGTELKQKLREVSDGRLGDDPTSSFVVIEGSANELDREETFHGRLDVVTELPGQQLFDKFFNEAWNFGVVNDSPLSLILVAIGSDNRAILKAVAEALSKSSGRSLDLVARVEASEFSVVLPETDLRGAVSVAARTRSAVQNALRKAGPGATATLNFGVAAIQPNARGNANAFVEVARRVLKSSIKSGDGQIAFVSDKGKIHLAVNRDAKYPAAAAAG